MDARDNAPLIAAGGGLLLFISLFVGWVGDFSAWEGFDFVDILFAAIALIAIGIGAAIATGTQLNLPSSPGSTVATAGLIAFSIIASVILEGEELKLGVYLALIGSIGIIVGGMQLARRTTVAHTTNVGGS